MAKQQGGQSGEKNEAGKRQRYSKEEGARQLKVGHGEKQNAQNAIPRFPERKQSLTENRKSPANREQGYYQSQGNCQGEHGKPGSYSKTTQLKCYPGHRVTAVSGSRYNDQVGIGIGEAQARAGTRLQTMSGRLRAIAGDPRGCP